MTATKPATGETHRRGQLVNRAVLLLASHWLALINLFWGLYIGLPFLAPIFMEMGWTTPARLIYTLYRPACHQRPERSFFVGGHRHVYTEDALVAAGVDVDPMARAIGNSAIGWKVAICERDVAMYGALFVAGLGYAALRRRLGRWRMPVRYYLPFLLPLAIDGALQLFAVYESSWLLRTLTGIPFGIGSVLFAYPYLEMGFGDVRRNLADRLNSR